MMLPNVSYPEYSFYYQLVVKQKRNEFGFLEQLDRGRLTEDVKHVKHRDEWEDIFAEAGFKIVEYSQHLSK